ncbi:protein angel homolog 2-like [Macrosteles quadrilineatus]|uniref:protein angel homolog 2-like n=1 Tax=Macrosteles quadrilineatus TaxID=74068 RepID=UPI0023E2EB4A|nr:protein angel homolog 2-like [Macrosteles quadrilineatus]
MVKELFQGLLCMWKLRCSWVQNVEWIEVSLPNRFGGQALAARKYDLQGKQKVRYEEFTPLGKSLEEGYDALYVPRGEGKPDGCALLYNASKFQITDFAPVLYFRPEMPLLDRPNVGMVATLELREHPGNCITVANTHFLYNQRRLDIKLSQLQILLAETERLAFAGLPDKYHPVILTGDLNVNPDTCLISLLRNRYVNCRNFNGQWRPVRDSEGRQLSVPDELLRDYLNISPDCQYTDVVEGRRRGIKDVKKTEVNILGDLQLKHRTAPFKPIKGLQLLSRLQMPSVPEYKSHFRNLPNFACGSDHLPLIASFLLPIH